MSYVPTFLRSYVPTFLRSYVPTFLRSYVPIPLFFCFDYLLFYRQNYDENINDFRHTNRQLYEVVSYPNISCNKNTHLLVIVISSPSALYERNVYRETVLSPVISGALPHVKYAFLLGRSAEPATHYLMDLEHTLYSDIIVGNFVDSYENLVLKSLFMLHWASKYCRQARFIYKLDNDVYADMAAISRYLKTSKVEKHQIIGSVFDKVRPIYSRRSKWYVSSYRNSTFPRYVSGTSYIMTSDLLTPTFEAAMNTSLLRLEDVFITGISTGRTGLDVKYRNVEKFRYYQKPHQKLEDMNLMNVWTLHSLNSSQLQYIWHRHQLQHSKLSKSH